MTDEKEVLVPSIDGLNIPTLLRIKEEAVATVVFVHGLTGDRDEVGGLLNHAAKEISNLNVNTVRFEFRGHGENQAPSKDMTVEGEFLDISAILEFLRERSSLPFILVGTSMGAVASLLSLSRLQNYIYLGVAFWNPVLHPRETFVSPGTDWSLETFKPFTESPYTEQVFLGDFAFGRGCWKDFESESLSEEIWDTANGVDIPILLLHGDADQIVPHSISERLSLSNKNVEFVSYPNELHGMTGVHEDMITRTKDWVCNLLA